MPGFEKQSVLLGVILALVSLSQGVRSWAQALTEDIGGLLGKAVRIDGLVDDTGRSVVLAPAGREAGPLILAPIYARCPHTCSPLAASLLRALNEAGERLGQYRVASVSIDPNESAENLRAFRQRLGLPTDWLLVRASDRRRLRSLLAELRFVAVERDDGQFDHPNVIYVLSADGVVTSVLPGLRLTAAELISAVEQARRGGAPWWRRYLFALAVLGFASSSGVFVATCLRRLQQSRVGKKRTEAVATGT